MKDPQFRRFLGDHQEHFIETIIKQSHFREYNRAFQIHNSKSVIENDFWNPIKMKNIIENSDLCSSYILPVSYKIKKFMFLLFII